MQKVLTIDVAGKQQLVDVGVSTSTGSSDAGKAVVTKTDGTIDETFLPAGIGADVQLIVASEDLTAGNLVNIWVDSGVFKVRKADASAYATKADGFVKTSALATESVKVYPKGINTGVTGVTGTDIFLSETAGAFTLTPPTTSGSIVQRVGTGLSSTSFNVEISPAVELA